MSNHQSFLHYVGIAAAVAVGGVVAWLVAMTIMGHVVTDQIEVLTEQAQESTNRIVQQAQEERDVRFEALKKQRAESELGKDLLRRCDEFTKFHGEHPSEYARQQREQACNAYSSYVLDGKVPR